MAQLRDKMNADLILAGLAESTRLRYIECAGAFVKHLRRSPHDLGSVEVREYLRFLLEERKLSSGRYRQHLAALRFLFGVTLGCPQVTDGIPWPRGCPRKTLVLSRQAVARVIDAAPSPFWRVFFTTAYATGLRRMEVAALAVGDIEADAGLVHVRNGKGGKPRSVMLDPGLLQILRQHWRTHRSPHWLFPGPMHGDRWSTEPVMATAASRAFAQAAQAAKLPTRATLHDLRHAFATHLLEGGRRPRDHPAVARPQLHPEHELLPPHPHGPHPSDPEPVREAANVDRVHPRWPPPIPCCPACGSTNLRREEIRRPARGPP